MHSEKEKMLSGKPYNAFSTELIAERQKAKELVYRFNHLQPSEIEERNEIIKMLFGKVQTNLLIEPPFRCDYGCNIEIGDNFYANYNLTILDCAKVTIGNNVLIAPNVSIYTAGHPIHHEPRNNGYEYAFPVNIGNNVWIGGNVVLNPGITIGDNSVIGAGSVVTRNIPANVVAAGNPCRVIKQILEEDKMFFYKNLPFK